MADRRLMILDGLRGLAALSVVLCHYYFFAGDQPGAGTTAWQPGRPFLDLIYKHGFRAVEVFWVISGFVFTYVYCFGRETDTREFAMNRFARLYPLHLVTLIVMALLQLAAFSMLGRYWVNDHNDLYHFILSLLMVSAWGMQDGPSYNDVIWSVSVEIAIYALFWVLRRRLLEWRAVGALVVAAFCGGIALLGLPNLIFACGFFFFFGAALALATFDLRAQRHGNASLITGLAITGAGILASGHPLLAPSLGVASLAGALVLLAVEGEACFGDRIRRAAQWLGDCSYGIYLWHMPLQLALVLILSRFVDMFALAKQGWFLAAYLTLLLALARASYLMVERPARGWLRRLTRRSPADRQLPATT